MSDLWSIEPGIDSRPRGAAERRYWRRRGGQAMAGCFTAFRANVPQFYADVNRTECMTKDVDLQDLFETLRVYLGSLYVNDFNRFGRTWQVIVQADAPFRRAVDGHPAPEGPQHQRHDGPGGGAGQLPREARSADPDAVQHVSLPPRSTATSTWRPESARGRRSTSWRTWPRTRRGAAAVDDLRVDRARLPRAAGGKHRDDDLRLRRGRWCSSCWRRSTRAGRCRWR